MFVDLKGKNAVVTGAARGLGKATAVLLAECGANVVIGDILEDAVKATAGELARMGVKSYSMKVDTTNFDQMKALFKSAKTELGSIDIVINAVGINCPAGVGEATEEELDRWMRVNIMGVDNGSKLALQYMKDQETGGRVINYSSTAGRSSNTINPYYSMTKCAVINLTQSYAKQAAALGITYNSICPGIIRTDMWQGYLESVAADRETQDKIFQGFVDSVVPMKCAQDPIDIAYATVFLVSEQSRYITGQALNIDGGQNMN